MPAIPWNKCRHVLQVHINASTRDATPADKKAILLIALGVEDVSIYFRVVEDQTQADIDGGTGNAEAVDAYEEALAVFNKCFSTEDETSTCLQFKRRLQSSNEFTVDFLLDI